MTFADFHSIVKCALTMTDDAGVRYKNTGLKSAHSTSCRVHKFRTMTDLAAFAQTSTRPGIRQKVVST